VTTDELIPTYEGRSIAQAAAEFGKIPVNLDQDLRLIDWREQARIDAAIYADYKNRFIKTDGSPERPLWMSSSITSRDRGTRSPRVSEGI
jgi:hypothetical protein